MKSPPLSLLFFRLAYRITRALCAFLLISALVVIPPFLAAIR